MATPTETRDRYPHFFELATRWADNDVYGHVNNATYYTYFDTAVNRLLIDSGVLDFAGSEIFGVVVETGCTYFSEIAFPDLLDIGLRVAKIGNSSVRYELSIFRRGESTAAATGHFVQVYVDRKTRKPVRVPDGFRAALAPAMAR